MKLRPAAAIAMALLAASPAIAVTMVSSPGAPDPGMAAGQTMLVSFDAPIVAGVTETTTGNVITGAASASGVRAAPAGTGTGAYQSIGTGGSALFDFSGWAGSKGLTSLSLYWGSIDVYNFIDFLNPEGIRIGGVSGSDMPLANGDQTVAMTNRRVFFGFTPQENVTAIRLRSTGNAFEFDSIGAQAGIAANISAGPVPEPEAWALCLIGAALVGAAMRYRRRHAAPAIAGA